MPESAVVSLGISQLLLWQHVSFNLRMNPLEAASVKTVECLELRLTPLSCGAQADQLGCLCVWLCGSTPQGESSQQPPAEPPQTAGEHHALLRQRPSALFQLQPSL